MALMADKKYTFLVHTEANKDSDQRSCRKKMFPGTKVAGVNTMNMDGKNKRVRGTMTFEKQLRQRKQSFS